MAFTSWSALRDVLKDALSDYASGAPLTKEYDIGGQKHVFRSVEEIEAMIDLTYRQEARELSGSTSRRVSYSKYSGII